MNAKPSGYLIAALLVLVLSLASSLAAQTADLRPPAPGDGVVRAKCDYPFGETIARLKKDIADKGLVFFSEIDQARLASDAKIALNPSTLLVFGNRRPRGGIREGVRGHRADHGERDAQVICGPNGQL